MRVLELWDRVELGRCLVVCMHEESKTPRGLQVQRISRYGSRAPAINEAVSAQISKARTPRAGGNSFW
jgi:hypothetical protein